MRYTRWEFDGRYPLRATHSDQVEVLGEVSYGTETASRRLMGRKLWLGLVAGANVIGGFHAGEFSSPLAESRLLAGGLTVEMQLASRFSLEVDGLYAPLHAVQEDSLPDGEVFRNPFTVLNLAVSRPDPSIGSALRNSPPWSELLISWNL